ncbi:MAG: hypothetical protein JXB49_33330 [Bacteroidales bacterium]|nr:hypothetical protein [Bacteroidales bacterium]MBN2817453.1 hypothetical protein [Bacteroidales bacterium]
MLNFKVKFHLLFLIGQIILFSSCEKNENNTTNKSEVIQNGFSKILKVTDLGRENFIELKIIGDDQEHVNWYLEQTEFSLETFIKVVNKDKSYENLIIDNYEIDELFTEEEYNNTSEEGAIYREEGAIYIEVVNTHIKNQLEYCWKALMKPPKFKTTNDIHTDKITFIKEGTSTDATVTGRISFNHVQCI